MTGTTLQRTLIRVQQVVRAVMAIGLLLGATLAFTENAESTLLVVNSLADDNVGSGNVGDLRYVINRANTLQTGTSTTPDLIQFTGITLTQTHHTISVGAGAAGRVPLPALTDAAIIDGTTAGGFSFVVSCVVNQQLGPQPVQIQTGLMLTLDGSHLKRGADGLTLTGSNTNVGGNATVRGLEIINFPGHGILVNSPNNTIGGDEVGYKVDGVNASGQLICERNNPAGRITVPPPARRRTASSSGPRRAT